jgi:hypothetical protein
MSESSNETPRREFLGQIAFSALALAGGACAHAPASVAPAATPVTPGAPVVSNSGTWDDSWTTRLTAKHRGVFDSPDIADDSTLGLLQAVRYLNGMQQAFGAAAGAAQVVVVLRHRSIPFALSDAMWSKYPIGEEYKLKSGDAWMTKNPGLASRRAGADSGDRPQGSLTWLAAHGHIILACDLALQGLAGTISQRANGNTNTIHDELKANLGPGVILQPNGIYAVHRAQEAGCTYIRST